MYLRHFGLEHSPFTRRPNPDVFFAQAGRKDILLDLRHDLQQGSAAMLLTGPEAFGKTVFCRLIRHRLDRSSYKVVYLENPVGSFDEILRQICLHLGMPLSADTEQDTAAVLRNLLEEQQAGEKRVLLLIDEAEKMFLAALERLFRLLNELNRKYGMQAVLVGQPALNISLEQLGGYCEDVRIASAYELAAFSAEETAAYLVYRLHAAGDDRGNDHPVFSGEAVQKIFRLSQGVPGVIDGIAEATLENAAAAGAGSALPVHVAVPADSVAVSTAFDDEKSGGKGKGLLLLLVLGLLALFFFGRPLFFSDKKEGSQETVQEPVAMVPENIEISLTVPEDEDVSLPFVEEKAASENPAEEPSVGKPSDPPKEAEEPALFPLPVPQRPDFKKKGTTPPVSEIAEKIDKVIEQVQQPEKTDKKTDPAVVAETAEESNTATAPALSSEELKRAVQAASSGGPESEVLATAKKLPVIKPTWIIELTPRMKKTRPPASENSSENSSENLSEDAGPEAEQEVKQEMQERQEVERQKKEAAAAPPKPKTLVPVASAKGVAASRVSVPRQPQIQPQSQPQIQPPVAAPVRKYEEIRAPQIDVTPAAPPSAPTETDRLFAGYLGAGKRWTKERYKNKFTVQLLVVSADDAVAKIKEMIVRDEYQEHQRKLYILRRDTLPPTLFVCYGVYSSMDEARNARNAMPLFLRKHHPYALSISDVLAKAGD
jgi:type II secretory pathway predicted ATPase ExeA